MVDIIKITLDDLRDINVANSICKAREDGDRVPEIQTELDIEMYESLELDGTFTVFEKEDGVFETVDLWTFLKRRILYNTMRMAQLHGDHKVIAVPNHVCYEFDRAQVSTIPDDELDYVHLQFDFVDYSEPRPLVFTLCLK